MRGRKREMLNKFLLFNMRDKIVWETDVCCWIRSNDVRRIKVW